MKKLLFSLLALSIGYASNAQVANVTLESTDLVGTVGATDFTGFTQYRIFAEMTSAADEVLNVQGDESCPGNISTTTSFYRHPSSAGIVGSGLPEGFFGFVAELRYQSVVTIGRATDLSLGIPFAEDATGYVAATGNAVTPLEGALPADAWITAFAGGGNIEWNSFNGGSYFTTLGGVNLLGQGVNNSVLLGAFTTAGDFSYAISIGSKADGVEAVTVTNCVDNIDNLLFPAPGCMDNTACNYDANADVDDLSCAFPGDACDDGDAGTTGEVYQGDCSCSTGPTDDCAGATALTVDGGTVVGDNTGTTDENDATDDTDADCWGDDGDDGDIWFSFEGTDGLVDIETFAGTNDDTQIAVYDACGGNVVACAEDNDLDFLSTITGLCTESGITYYIEVEGYDGTEGTFDIEVRTSLAAPFTYCSDISAANYTDPATVDACAVEDNSICSFNDICADAIALTIDGGTVSGDNTGTNDENDATDDTDAACWGDDGDDGDVWYSFDGTGGYVDIETFAGTNDDTQIALYDACDGNVVACNDDKDADNDDYMSLIKFCTDAGATYYIEVEGWSGTEGTFDIEVRSGAPETVCTDPAATNYEPNPTACDTEDNSTCIAPTVANDVFVAAAPLGMSTFPVCTPTAGTVTGATDSPESPNALNDVWYSIVPSQPGIKIEITSDDFDILVGLYDGTGTLITEQDFFVNGEVVFADAVAGDTYYVAVSDVDGFGGDFDICAQDLPENAVAAAQLNASFSCTSAVVSSAFSTVDGSVWRFDNGVDPEITYFSNSPFIDLVDDAGLSSGVYTVFVDAIYEGFQVTSTFSTTLTVEEPTSALKGAYRGATVTLIDNAFVRCVRGTACGWESFQWLITDVETGDTYDFNTTTDLLRIQNIPGITYEKEYVAEVAVVYNGGTESAFGTAYNFFVGGVPLISLRSVDNSDNTSLIQTQNIWTTRRVVGASQYTWEVSRTDVVEIPFEYSSGVASRAARVFNIPLAEGGTYNLRVKGDVPGFTSSYGPVEEVVVIGGVTIPTNDGVLEQVVLNEPQVKEDIVSVGIEMYPNPTADFVTLTITDIEEGTDKVLVDIFNAVGQVVQTEQLVADGNYVNSVVSLDGLSEGVYNVQITVGSSVTTQRMMIQK